MIETTSLKSSGQEVSSNVNDERESGLAKWRLLGVSSKALSLENQAIRFPGKLQNRMAPIFWQRPDNEANEKVENKMWKREIKLIALGVNHHFEWDHQSLCPSKKLGFGRFGNGLPAQTTKT